MATAPIATMVGEPILAQATEMGNGRDRFQRLQRRRKRRRAQDSQSRSAAIASHRLKARGALPLPRDNLFLDQRAISSRYLRLTWIALRTPSSASPAIFSRSVRATGEKTLARCYTPSNGEF